MKEIARVTLSNEMDLILAHRRSMKLAELAGLSLSVQTTFATAVSEVSRNIIENGQAGYLMLSINTSVTENYLVATIRDNRKDVPLKEQGIYYARKLVNRFNLYTSDEGTMIEMQLLIPPSVKFIEKKIADWQNSFSNDEPLSPYEEIKRQNEQLQSLTNQLKSSESQYRTLTNALPLIIFSLNGEGQLIFANQWLYNYAGKSIDELNYDHWQSVIHPDDLVAFQGLFSEVVAHHLTHAKIECRLRQKSTGHYFWHLAAVAAVETENDVTPGIRYIGYMVDIHTQKEFEELKQVKEKLQRNELELHNIIHHLNLSNRELEQFAYVASHDLQEPVRKMIFYSDYFLQNYASLIDETGAGFLQKMLDASHRMRTLITDLLAFSRIRKEETTFQQVDLNKVVKGALQDLEMLIAEKGALVTCDPLPGLEGNYSQLVQLFENILSNALKYSQETGQPVIHISAQTADEHIVIAIKDNGIGFEEKYLPKMFTLFQRLHGKHEYYGTGLGLAICKKIADLHSGRIDAVSTPGKGATFTVTLPAIQINKPA